ncbi:uncharacterized protein J8A68_000140, partial [[Candida] subhashii]
MLIRNILLPFYLIFASVFADTVIDTNTVTRGFLEIDGSVTVESDSYWAIIDNALTSFVGDVRVQEDATLYITSLSPSLALTVEMLNPLHLFVNKGTTVFNSMISLSPPRYQIAGQSFVNTGEIYFVGGSAVIPPVFDITTAEFDNQGLITFYQDSRSTSLVNLGVPTTTINNEGNICFFNSVYGQSTAITGNGCMTANMDTTIYLSNALLGVPREHTFVLADSESSIVADAFSTVQTFTVSGFGRGNKVGLTCPLFEIPFGPKEFEYDPQTGILTLRCAGLLATKFDIGLGYDPNGFRKVTDSGGGFPATIGGSVTYDGPIPNEVMPEHCMPCQPIPGCPLCTPEDDEESTSSEVDVESSTTTVDDDDEETSST